MNFNIENTVWHFFHIRKRSPLLLYFFYYLPAIVNENELPCKISTSGSCLDKIITKKSDLDELSDRLWSKVESHPELLIKFMSTAYKKHNKNIIYWRKKYLKKDWEKDTNKDLLNAYNNFINRMYIWGDYVYAPLAIEDKLTKEAEEILSPIFLKNVKEAANLVLTPVKKSCVMEEALNLHRLSSFDSKKIFEQEMKKHIEKF